MSYTANILSSSVSDKNASDVDAINFYALLKIFHKITDLKETNEALKI